MNDLKKNWLEEQHSAYLYGVMATQEKNILHKKLFHDLKIAAEKQGELWAKKMQAYNIPYPMYQPTLRVRLVASLIKIFGTDALHRILPAMKIRGMSVFNTYHSEHKHTSMNATSNLRAAIFGVNDGLISNMSLILGIAGAGSNQHFIFLTGIAGLLAGACSMGAGEYISVRSQREVFEYQIAIEKKELAEYPEEEAEELSLIYQARGLPTEEATRLANFMISNPQQGLDALAREELGLNPEDLVSPIGAMIFSFLSFAVGAFIPLIPFLFSGHTSNLIISMGLTGTALFCIGMVLSLFTNRNPFLLGARMLFIGCVAGSLTFIIGRWLGVNLN
ncbi:MAG: VIT1/CCC1 transporter family protein [Gammaproteobacteria bacterium]|nr:VIT1/CCC1 transporter family protein [Gammaproteobacteria bacterium]